MTELMPRIVEVPAFRIVGVVCRSSVIDTSAIPPLWEQFCSLMHLLPPHEGIYGVSLPVSSDPVTFDYFACARVADDAPTPQGMVEIIVPACRYAVYPFKGQPALMGQAFEDIYSTRLAAVGLSPAPMKPSLELYDEDCMDEATGEMQVDLYIAL